MSIDFVLQLFYFYFVLIHFHFIALSEQLLVPK